MILFKFRLLFSASSRENYGSFTPGYGLFHDWPEFVDSLLDDFEVIVLDKLVVAEELFSWTFANGKTERLVIPENGTLLVRQCCNYRNADDVKNGGLTDFFLCQEIPDYKSSPFSKEELARFRKEKEAQRFRNWERCQQFE